MGQSEAIKCQSVARYKKPGLKAKDEPCINLGFLVELRNNKTSNAVPGQVVHCYMCDKHINLARRNGYIVTKVTEGKAGAIGL